MGLECIITVIFGIGDCVGCHDRNGDTQLIAFRDHLSKDIGAPIKLMVTQTDRVIAHHLHHLQLSGVAGRQQLKEGTRHPIAGIVQDNRMGRRSTDLVDQSLGTSQTTDRTVITRRPR